jgi:hypothetical protein
MCWDELLLLGDGDIAIQSRYQRIARYLTEYVVYM